MSDDFDMILKDMYQLWDRFVCTYLCIKKILEKTLRSGPERVMIHSEPICLAQDVHPPERDSSLYRLAYQTRIIYVEVHPTANIKHDDLVDNRFIISFLRPFHTIPQDSNWADIWSTTRIVWSYRSLKGVNRCWHPAKIDLRELRPLEYFTPQVCKVEYNNDVAIAKFARFEYEIQFIEQETRIYEIINGHDIGPRFLGHLTEANRVVGMLLEYIDDARNPTVNDLEGCVNTLRQLHQLQICHNDINLYNFLIRQSSNTVLLCDFEICETDAGEEKLFEEQSQLKKSLEKDFRASEGHWTLYGRDRLGHKDNNYWL